MSLLAEQTTTTARETLADVEVAVLPTGSTEQHGPALPLGTDYMTAEAIAHTTAEREDCVVLPTIPVGVSEHHRQFDGTLWTDPETFERYVGDVLASAASHGVGKAVVVNGHGGNTDALRRAARDLRGEGVAFVAPWDWWEGVSDAIADEFDAPGGHADAVESSMLLSIADDLVREEELAAAEKGGSESWGLDVHGADVGFDTVDFTESGAVGRPTRASAEAGDRLFEAAAERLDMLVDWLAAQDVEELSVKPHR